MSRYRFIQAERARYPIAVMCRVLGVARSGYSAWLEWAAPPGGRPIWS